MHKPLNPLLELKLSHHFHSAFRKLHMLLNQGTSPEKLSMTVAVGIILGLFPIIGTTSVLCLGASLTLRLNKVFIQMVNYMVYPLQLVLFIPLIKAGNEIFQLTGHPVNYQNLLHLFRHDTFAALGEFTNLLMAAIILWAVAAVPLTFILYHSSLKYMKRLKVKI